MALPSPGTVLDVATERALQAIRKVFPLTSQYIGILPACRVNKSAGQTLTSGAFTAITFDAERFDTDSMHDTSSNTNRITAQTKGIYAITGNLRFASNATGDRGVLIRTQAGVNIGFDLRAASGTDVVINHISTLHEMNVGDWVELVGYQTSGGNLNVQVAANYSPEFMAHWVSDF